MTLVAHAVAPPGEWINDPNGLVHAQGRWRLFVQHRADGPAFRVTGWARLSSDDLRRWDWDGPVIAPDAEGWAYSGSVVATPAGLESFHTRHRDGYESQVRAASADAGLTWSPLPLDLPAECAGANRRDPFVFGADGDWWMLLARPCAWSGDVAATSHLIVLRSPDRARWTATATIGPWHPPGVMWEVPVLIRDGDRDLLLISLVDRRGGGAECSVHGWTGRLDQTGFTVDPGCPRAGQRIDLGPDFYAAISGAERVVAWLASWATARTMPWPGFAGGPITLPRRLFMDGAAIRHTVAAEAGDGRLFDLGTANFTVSVATSICRLDVIGDGTDLTVVRRGAGLDWRRRQANALKPATARRARLFSDGPAVEIFIEPDGCSITAAVPGDDPVVTVVPAASVSA